MTQEFRLSGQNGKLDWSAGAFFADEKLTRRDSLLYGADYEGYVSRLLSRSASNPPRMRNI